MDPTRTEIDTRSFDEMHFTLAFEEIKLKVEAILFASDRPLEVTEIRDCIGNVSLTDVRLAIKDLGHDFESRSVEIVEIGRKYQLRTRAVFADTVTKLFSGKPRSLSKSSLETLAIVAYRQPVTRAEVNALRQVDSSQVMISLREKELIFPSGTRKEAGHPVEYKTTQKFLDLFGLSDLSELPKLRSLQMNEETKDQVKQALDQLDAKEDEEPLSSKDLSLLDPTEEELSTSPAAPPPNEPATLHGSAQPDEPADHPQEEGMVSQKRQRSKPRRLDNLESLLKPIGSSSKKSAPPAESRAEAEEFES